MPNWTPEQQAAIARGEARAEEAMRAGKEQLAAQAATNTPTTSTVKTVPLRPDRWAKCPVCHAPSINPKTNQCEMASCETRKES